MHPSSTVRQALQLADAGENTCEISRALGIPRETVRDWIAGALPHSATSAGNDRCGGAHRNATLGPDYVYLLGLYLGDGCISAAPRDVYKLRIFLDLKYPGIIAAAAAAAQEVRGKPVGTLRKPQNCVEVFSFWKCWPCLFPQHGPGRKHHRKIELEPWQQQLAEARPDRLLRGLIHSDGCRFRNTGRRWRWPRYAFSNRSSDIRRIFCDACETVGVHWTASGKYTIYVSRKADVATLDEFIGPKR